jgi:hypothetical protein
LTRLRDCSACWMKRETGRRRDRERDRERREIHRLTDRQTETQRERERERERQRQRETSLDTAERLFCVLDAARDGFRSLSLQLLLEPSRERKRVSE